VRGAEGLFGQIDFHDAEFVQADQLVVALGSHWVEFIPQPLDVDEDTVLLLVDEEDPQVHQPILEHVDELDCFDVFDFGQSVSRYEGETVVGRELEFEHVLAGEDHEVEGDAILVRDFDKYGERAGVAYVLQRVDPFLPLEEGQFQVLVQNR